MSVLPNITVLFVDGPQIRAAGILRTDWEGCWQLTVWYADQYSVSVCRLASHLHTQLFVLSFILEFIDSTSSEIESENFLPSVGMKRGLFPGWKLGKGIWGSKYVSSEFQQIFVLNTFSHIYFEKHSCLQSWAFWWSCGGDSASFCCLLYPVGTQISPLSIFLCQLSSSIWFSSSKNSCVYYHCLFHSTCPWRAHLFCCDEFNVETKDISALLFNCKLLSTLLTFSLFYIFALLLDPSVPLAPHFF